jgi:hypothetical protein
VTCNCQDEEVLKLPRVPYIIYPNICCLCGKLDPPLFGVPDHMWCHYVEPRVRKKIICEPCWHWSTWAIDFKEYATQHGDVHGPASEEFWRRVEGPLDERVADAPF